jgi:hypothetical protein
VRGGDKDTVGVSGRAESGAAAPNRKRKHFSFYFMKNSNIFTFLSNKNPVSQVGPKIKVI